MAVIVPTMNKTSRNRCVRSNGSCMSVRRRLPGESHWRYTIERHVDFAAARIVKAANLIDRFRIGARLSDGIEKGRSFAVGNQRQPSFAGGDASRLCGRFQSRIGAKQEDK